MTITREDAAFEACVKDVLMEPYPNDGQLYCNATWDSWGCFNYTLAGSRTFIQCPDFILGFDSSLRAHKDCNADGTWWRHPKTNATWTNYTSCVNEGELELSTRVIFIFIAGYSISILALLMSLGIFFYFKQLHCDRVTLHKHLFFSYILNGTIWIVYYTQAAMNGDVLMNNPWWCQVLHVITQYFVACNFFWMFCEGLYLHTIIVVAFTSGKKLPILCLAIGWGFPMITTTIYAITRGLKKDGPIECWLQESSLQWIVFGPIVITIVLNFAFLCNIVRVLVTKLRSVNSPDTNQTRKAVRATLILIPLLGLQYILLPFRPSDNNPALLQAYLYVSAMVASFQGFLVALIFCFLNGEVISVVKRKWGQHRLMQFSSRGQGRTAVYTTTSMSMMDSTPFSNNHHTSSNEKRSNHSGLSSNNRREKKSFCFPSGRLFASRRTRSPNVPASTTTPLPSNVEPPSYVSVMAQSKPLNNTDTPTIGIIPGTPEITPKSEAPISKV